MNDERTYVPLNTLSPKMRRILRWLLSEDTQRIIESDCNWKATINCSQTQIKTTIEKFEQIS